VDQDPVAAEWILRAMLATATADGKIDEREIVLVQQTYRELTAKDLARDDITKAAEANAKADDFLAELAAVAPLLSAPTKEEIIRATYLVLLADGQISGEEGKKLEDIAEALGIARLQLGTILDDLAVSLATRHQ
jgi:tellurite resistance protein